LDAEIFIPSESDPANAETQKLGFSRAYSLALAPQLIYSRSALLPSLVSSKVYRQLEFVAVGAWWIYERAKDSGQNGQVKKIPGSREDVFADKSIDLRSKRSLMKFLKLITDTEAFSQAVETFGDNPFGEFLTAEYNIPLNLQYALHALTLSLDPIDQTKTSYALPRILRHLSSIGVFGPGFGSVIPKWGGLAEITQVCCRACAVGGGIYMLNHDVGSAAEDDLEGFITLPLSDGENVKTKCKVDHVSLGVETKAITRSISIISSPLKSLFPAIADGAPPPAGSVVVFPPGSLHEGDEELSIPVYLMIHTSETGECPAGQCKSVYLFIQFVQ
jgi:Rab proteins geranylgeranyltransferase component A